MVIFFPNSGISSHIHANKYPADFRILCASLSCPVLLQSLAALVPPDFHLCLLSLGSFLSSPESLLTVSQPGNTLEAVNQGKSGLSLFFSLFLKDHCPSLPNVQCHETVVSYILCAFCCFRWKSKCSSCELQLAMSMSYLNYILLVSRILYLSLSQGHEFWQVDSLWVFILISAPHC